MASCAVHARDPVAPVSLDCAELDHAHRGDGRAELGGEELQELGHNLVLRLASSEGPLGVERIEEDNSVADRVRIDPDVVDVQCNPRGAELHDSEVVGLAEAVVTENWRAS